MSALCKLNDCYPTDTGCDRGNEPYTACPNLQMSGDATAQVTEMRAEHVLPWSGHSLGTVDLQFVAARSKPTTVGVVGPHNAGKTTMLTMTYLSLLHGLALPARTFAGSFTIGSWETLAHTLRWHMGHRPTFPPHTSSGTQRLPGLLHLAFRNTTDGIDDVLFTDAPGEWFGRWAIDKHAPDAEGARWISRYADAFMLFADSEALAGPKRGEARNRFRALAERLSSEAQGRRVALVWSKADIAVPTSMRATIKDIYNGLFPDGTEFRVSARSDDPFDDVTGRAFLEVVHWAVQPHIQLPRTQPAVPVQRPDDPFLAFRGH